MTKTPLGQALIKGLKEAVEMEKSMKSYEEIKTDAAKKSSKLYTLSHSHVTAPKQFIARTYEDGFNNGHDAGHARALKASEGLVEVLKELKLSHECLKAALDLTNTDFCFSGASVHQHLKEKIEIANKAIEQFQREVGK